MAWWQWSKTAISNAGADPAINFAEGQSPSSLNDSCRALMAALAAARDDLSGALTTSGTSIAYTITTNASGLGQAWNSTPNNGQSLCIIPNATCGASPTLTVDGGTAFPLQTAPGVAVSSAAMVQGTPYTVTFNSSQSAYILNGVFGGIVSSIGSGFGLTGGPITTSGTLSIATTNPPYGYNAPINLQLNASIGSSLLTIAVKGNNGSDPSASNPVLIPFGDTTLGSGDPVWVAITSALSISTNAIGASLGTSNNVPFRFWIVAFNNGGTGVLALINCWNGSAIFPLNEDVLQSTTGISAAAGSAAVFYTPNGTNLSSKAFKILGYLEYSSGLATAGTYGSAPSKLRLFGPGTKKPGDVMQKVLAQNAVAASTGSSAMSATNLTGSIIPSSAANLIQTTAAGNLTIAAAATSGQAAIRRASSTSTVFTNLARVGAGAVTTSLTSPASILGIDAPGSASSVTYGVYIASSDNSDTVTWSFGNYNSTLLLEELMG